MVLYMCALKTGPQNTRIKADKAERRNRKNTTIINGDFNITFQQLVEQLEKKAARKQHIWTTPCDQQNPTDI